MSKKILTLLIISLIAVLFLLYQISITFQTLEKETVEFNKFLPLSKVAIKNPVPEPIKGIYLTAYSAGNPQKLDEIIKLLNQTELNAVVIDIKDASGYVLFDSQLALVKELKLKDNRLKNLPAIIQKLHSQNIYVIARQTVFQDPLLAEKKPEWSLKDKNGQIWRDKKGLAWVDMTNPKIWNYNLLLAKEAAKLGFDEINFDYVRFPSDGLTKNIDYGNNQGKLYEVMQKFYHFLNLKMSKIAIWTSVDFFGLVMERNDDLGIGQRLIDAASEVDFICPMMYPSHYYSGHLGFDNPADHPAEIINNGLKKGLLKMEDRRAKIRPWLQAFNLGAVYDADKIRQQIEIVEKYLPHGWLLWNAANHYTTDGLKNQF